ncbi:outer membrane lipoprotein chaperone LolA [Candidatus Steffania adelgidicola]|uniref:outer membrane lipoprotein chaperone LolA n=1 Tax=Candidatus Steffania adelgidicola TaxID=1076626 RepID=UPI001D017091|nr:outer membrane lipoprotein chaperone LolA [Candidatus Steffania adelgidicola]UDG79822.1 Outer-membrane lipoprotein carrier protein [Candidatus Steffania adelgidicola]
MQKRLMIVYCLAAILSAPVFGDDADVLKNRLNKINSFYAHFVQKVTGTSGDLIQEGKGEIWVKRPNLFNWHITEPDESRLISDGKTLWFYNPFVKQATANYLKKSIENTPFMLILTSNSEDWRQYHVRQDGNDFWLVPKSDEGNPKEFRINITDNGTMKAFSIVEHDGLCSVYELKNQKQTFIDNVQFKFTIPQNATLDDQR